MLNTDMITHERLTELLNYDPNTGIFTWRVARGNRPDLQPGSIAGNFSLEKGRNYCRITVDDIAYKAHRLAWYYMTKEWPKKSIDHIEGDGSDNRWNNLRLASHSENQWNAKRRNDNSSGYKGVCFSTAKQSWMFSLQVNGKRTFKYGFNTAEDAYNELAAQRLTLHGQFAHDGVNPAECPKESN